LNTSSGNAAIAGLCRKTWNGTRKMKLTNGQRLMPVTKHFGEDRVLQIEDPVEALKLLAHATMRPFTKDDWYSFNGCETKDPMIGEFGEWILVLDGATLNIIHVDDGYGGTLFELVGRN